MARAPGTGLTSITYGQAVNRALGTELEERPDVLVFGEDVGAAGGIADPHPRLGSHHLDDRLDQRPRR